jgi:hypothetical protein
MWCGMNGPRLAQHWFISTLNKELQDVKKKGNNAPPVIAIARN